MYMYVFMLFFYCLFIYINGYIYIYTDGYTDLHIRDNIYIYVHICT